MAGVGILHETRLYPPRPMNTLILGSAKGPILDHLPDTFLLIDDGPIIDALQLPERRAVTVFDPAHHAFNPLKDMTYLRARSFVDLINAAFPEGESTLTRRISSFHILTALLSGPKGLDTLIRDTKDTRDAYQKIQTLLLSPVLAQVITRPTNLSFKGTILARLNRAELGDFDCFFLANLLIQQYPGPVVIPDFGFYSCPFHVDLIRQNRLTVSVNALDEVPRFRNALVQFERKVGSRSTPEDAAILADYLGLTPRTVAHNDFIHRSINAVT